MDLVRAAGRHEIIDGGDAHHVEETAAKGVAVTAFGRRMMETALGQSLVAERAITSAIFRNFFAAKRTLSNGHTPLGPRADRRTQDTTCIAPSVAGRRSGFNTIAALRGAKDTLYGCTGRV